MHVSCVQYNHTSAFVRRTGVLKLASVSQMQMCHELNLYCC